MKGRTVKVISGSYEGTYGRVVSIDLKSLTARVEVSQQSFDKAGSSTLVFDISDLKTID